MGGAATVHAASQIALAAASRAALAVAALRASALAALHAGARLRAAAIAALGAVLGERIGKFLHIFLLSAHVAFGFFGSDALNFIGQSPRRAGGFLHVLLGHARQLDLGVGGHARNVLLIGAQLVSGRLGAGSSGADDVGLTVSGQQLLAGLSGLFQHGLGQLDVQVAQLLERLKQRLRHVIHKRNLCINVRTYGGSYSLGIWKHK